MDKNVIRSNKGDKEKLVKIAGIEFRGVLDYGHLIPIGLTNTLASIFDDAGFKVSVTKKTAYL